MIKKVLALLTVFAVVCMAIPYGAVFAEGATTYYVSAENGSDANDGLSLNSAFKTISNPLNILTCFAQNPTMASTAEKIACC